MGDKVERQVAEVVGWIPVVGTLYEAGAAAAYVGMGDIEQANKCGENVGYGALVDVAGFAAGGGARALYKGGKLVAGGAKVYRAGGKVRNVGGVMQAGTKIGGKKMIKDGGKQIGKVVATDFNIKAGVNGVRNGARKKDADAIPRVTMSGAHKKGEQGGASGLTRSEYMVEDVAEESKL